jgi:hypothetical protein
VKPSNVSSLDHFERRYVAPKVGRTLIVGSRVYGSKEDRRLRHADALGVDMLEGPGVDQVVDLEEPLPPGLGQFAHVECMSVLEHSRRPWLLAGNLERLMEPGATIFVSVPFVWRVHAYPSDYWRLTPEGVRSIFPGIEWQALMLASDDLRKGVRLPAARVGGHPFLARAETVGFGVKR